MNSYSKFLLIVLLFCFSSSAIVAQKFIRLDKNNTVLSKKFFIGEDLHFTLKTYPKVWRAETIRDLDFDSQAVVFDRDLLVMDQIGKVRTYQPWARSLGTKLYVFSASWFVFGGIIHATTDFKVDGKTAAIGGSAFLLGFILDKFISQTTHNLGKRWKLRILDTNF